MTAMKKQSEREKLIQQIFGRQAVARREVRAKLEQLELAPAANVRQVLSELPTVRIETASPLSPEAEVRLGQQLEGYVSEPVQFELIVNSAVVGGAVVSFRGRRLDASWGKQLDTVDYAKL